MKRNLLVLLVLGLFGFGLWGCRLNTTSATVTPAGVTFADRAARSTLTPTQLSLITVAITSTLQLTTSDALNIRSGPGLYYPIVGVFAAGAGVAIIGRVSDGTWWRVACPPSLSGGECWVVNEATIMVVTGSGAAPVLPAPPVPPTATPVPTSTPTPCVAAAPAGWLQQLVRAGDTLSAISERTGATVEQLRSANCLLSDTIIAGDTLFAPSGFGQQAIGGMPSVNENPPPATPLPLPTAGVAAVLQHINPGAEGCPLTGATPRLFIVGVTETQEQRKWELGEKFIICALGFATATPVTPVTMQVVQPDATTQLKSFNPRRARWTWLALSDAPLGAYTVTASQGITTVTAVFTITLPSRPHLLALVDSAAPGDTIPFVVAGLQPGQQLYLYRLQFPEKDKWTLVRALAPAPLGARRATNYEVHTMPSDQTGRYLVHTGELINIDTEQGPNMFVLR